MRETVLGREGTRPELRREEACHAAFRTIGGLKPLWSLPCVPARRCTSLDSGTGPASC